jgi:hypothetical protein
MPAAGDLRRTRGTAQPAESVRLLDDDPGSSWPALSPAPLRRAFERPRGGANAVNARDRIGNGPCQNAKGVAIATSVADLHGDNTKLGNQCSR